MNNDLEIILLINSKMSIMSKTNQQKISSSNQSLNNLMMINKKVHVGIGNVGNNIKETLEKVIASEIEGKCIVQGYIKPNSVEIITFSSGLVSSNNIVFEVVFQCYVCSPVEGMQINCFAKHINKAGIRAEVKDTPSPVVIFIARDHNYSSQLFSQVQANDNINVRVIGQRFELNDTYISIIAQLIEETSANKHIEQQPKNGDEEPTSQLNVEPSQPIVKKKTSLLKIRKSKPKLTINE